MIVIILVASIPLIIHLIGDFKGVVHHRWNAVYVTGLSVGVGLVLPGHWWQGVIFALSIHFCFFDPFYNITHGHNLFYYGDPNKPKKDQAFTDRFIWSRTPIWGAVFLRLWVLWVGWAVYFELDKILGYL